MTVGVAPGDTATPLLIEEQVRRAGIRDPRLMPADELDALVHVVAVSLRVEDDNCGGPVTIARWRERLDAAEEAVLRLRIEDALAAIADADLTSGCLDRVPARLELQRLHLLNARANLLASRQWPDQADFYRDQARYAVRAMQGLGDDLLLPDGLEPELAAFVRGIERADQPTLVAAAGPGGAVHLDGQRVGRTPVARPAGTHLVQIESGGVVSAAAVPPFVSGPNLVYAGLYSAGDLEMAAWDVGFDGLASETLQAVSALLRAPLVVAAWRDGQVLLRQPDGRLVEGRAPPRVPDVAATVAAMEEQEAAGFRAAVTDWQAMVGAGLSASTSSYVGGPVDLAGPAGGLAVWYRRTVADFLVVAGSLDLVARSELLDVHHDDDLLWRAHLPLRAGLHAGQPSRGVGWDAGVDLALIALGPFEDRWCLRFGALPTAGVVIELLDGLAMRVEAHGGGGFGAWWSAGGRVGFERAW